MANKEQLELLRGGVHIWNQWRQAHHTRTGRHIRPDLDRAELSAENLSHFDFSSADLSGAELSGAELIGADFGEANLDGARFESATARRANFAGASLSGASFDGANLRAANFCSARLEGANFASADLRGANFSGASLADATFRDAHFGNTTFGNCNLQYVKGLESVSHAAPSAVGVEVIYKSKGKIPESFLRGCGVPESFITQMHSLVGAVDGIQFYSCFISYSSKDEEFARRLHGRMRDAHLRVWFAPEDIQGGQKLHEQIETAIRVYDKLLIVLSEASLQSEWVMTELRKARKAERQSGKRKLFPVRLVGMETLRDWECFDADSGKDLATELREYFIPDFSHWKEHDSFEAAFARLLKDLKSDAGASS